MDLEFRATSGNECRCEVVDAGKRMHCSAEWAEEPSIADAGEFGEWLISRMGELGYRVGLLIQERAVDGASAKRSGDEFLYGGSSN